MARSGRRSSGSTTRSSPRSCRTPARRASRASATSPAASTPTGSSSASTRPSTSTPRRSTRSAWTRSRGSTPRSPPSPAATIGAASLADALAQLRSDPSLYFTTGDEVFDKAASSLARANEAIPDWFGRLPIAPCDVVRMGAHEEEHSTIAYYRQPATDGSRPGQYFINTSHPTTRPRYEAEALAYHEAVPGHHLQIAIAQELADLPEFRKHLGPTAFVEGWGLYTERLSDEMGLYAATSTASASLSFDAWRAVAARRRHRDARPRLAARPGDRSSWSSTRPSRPTTSRTRSTATS